jgi:nucleoside-diphosphate-sugar epimerase
MRQRVLVLGGAGYIGSVLTSKLLSIGHEVVVYDRLLHGSAPLASPRLQFVKGDIRDGSMLSNAARRCTQAVHLAGISIDGAIRIPRELGLAINLESFEPTLKICLNAGVARFIFASTCSVYGNRSGDVVDEAALPQPNTLYGTWKLACEEILFGYSHRVNAIALRAATTCGPSPRQRFDLLLNRMVATAYFDRRIAIAAPAAIRPAVHIDDLADAYVALLAAKAESVAGEVFHCAYENRTQSETASLVREIIGLDVRLEFMSEISPRSYSIDSAKIAQCIDFRPRRAVRDAVETLRMLFDQKHFPDALTSSKYNNLLMEAEALALFNRADARRGSCFGN